MPLENPFYTPEIQGPYELRSIGRFELEEGGVIPDLQLAVATFGELNEARDNAILVPTWFSGTHATWWQVYIGEGRARARRHDPLRHDHRLAPRRAPVHARPAGDRRELDLHGPLPAGHHLRPGGARQHRHSADHARPQQGDHPGDGPDGRSR